MTPEEIKCRKIKIEDGTIKSITLIADGEYSEPRRYKAQMTPKSIMAEVLGGSKNQGSEIMAARIVSRLENSGYYILQRNGLEEVIANLKVANALLPPIKPP